MRHLLVRGMISFAVATVGVFLAGATANAQTTTENDPVAQGAVTIQVAKLTNAQAQARLRAAGITWSSSGNCSDRNNSTCTSFEQVNLTTIEGAETLKRASGCALNITGGTETGHASGTYSHWNGYKLDFTRSTCLTNYVHNTFTSIGGGKWQSAAGNIYFDESNHWDVTFFNCGGC